MDIWSLPGPSLFVDDIEDAVRDGASVIARFPSEVSQRTGTGVEGAFALAFRMDFHRCVAGRLGSAYISAPADMSGCQCCLKLASITELAVTDSFQGRLVWIEKIDSGMWPDWSRFLRAYSDACRNVDILNRTVFIVLLSGEPVTGDVPEEVALVRCDFRGAVDTLDLFIFALRQDS